MVILHICGASKILLPISVQDDRQSGLFFDFTALLFWQIHNCDISKPFQEINYEPEIFYDSRSDFHVLAWVCNYPFYNTDFLRLSRNHDLPN